jgi:hypothetical protein
MFWNCLSVCTYGRFILNSIRISIKRKFLSMLEILEITRGVDTQRIYMCVMFLLSEGFMHIIP